MINKKFLLIYLMLFMVFTSFAFADDKNFVSVLNGSQTASQTNSKSYTFVGQPVVFDTNDSIDYISQSAFASVISRVQSSSITFTNNTEDIVFTDIEIPVKVNIVTNYGTLNKVRYRISQGSGGIWEDEIDYSIGSNLTEVDFSKTISFSKGYSENYVQIYAQYKGSSDSDYGGSWSPAYSIKISTALSDIISFTSPDPLTKVASLDPVVQTTNFSLNLTTATVSLYEGDFASGTPLYEIELTTTTNVDYKMYNEEESRISYSNSDVIKIYNEKHGSTLPTKLTQNKNYTFKVSSSNGDDTVTFKAVGDGVGDIVTYPSPFNPKKEKIKIRYLLAKDSRVTIKLYDKAGKIVKKLIQSESKSAGTNEEEWDGRNYAGETLATGAYICEIIANSSDGEHRRYTALAIVGR